MQGFNRYIAPDYDPRQNSTLNSHAGKKHALGKRAKDIDKGVLVVRFELPFNIWCDSCNNHIGAGVRYNAQKKRVGSYYSTPIYGFRCKCHLCQHWFEIRTDPQNAAYVVHEGAKRKEEDWNPEENGGFATHDTEAPSAADPPADAFAATEKTIDQQTWAKKHTSRLTDLYEASDKQSADPYTVSQNLRRKFRVEKQEMMEKQGRDDDMRERYALADDVDLGDEDVEGDRARWEAGRERRGLPVLAIEGEGAEGGESVRAVHGTPALRTPRIGGSAAAGGPALAQVLRQSTKRRYDPFADSADGFSSATPLAITPKSRGKGRDVSGAIVSAKVRRVDPFVGSSDLSRHAAESMLAKSPSVGVAVKTGVGAGGGGLGLLAGYESD